MKAELIGRKFNQGMSTLEILIAFAVVILCVSAVIMVVFGNQSVAVDLQTNNEAIAKAQTVLEDARATSRQDYSLVKECDDSGADPCSGTPDSFYNRTLTINPASVTQCGEDVKSTTSWLINNRILSVDFVTHLGDIATALALGGDCIIDPPGGGGPTWTNPQTFTTANIDPSGNKGTDIDVIKIDEHKYGFLTSIHPSIAKDDLWSFDLETTPPTPLDHIDTGPGLNAVDVARASNGNYYAYLANNNNSVPYEQLIVVNVTDPTNISEVPGARRSLPGVAGADPASRAVYYYDERLYIGTKLTAGNEFNIYGVENPENPLFLGQREINHSIRKIVVRGTSAYLATTANNNELMVFDINTPGSIQPPWGGPGSTEPGYNASGNEDGTSIFLLGNIFYLGRARTASGRPELFILKTSDLSISASTNLGLNPSSATVQDIDAVSNFIFLGTSDSNAEFQVWNKNDLNSRVSYFNFPQAITGLEYMDNKIYVSVDSNNALHIIYDAP